MFRPVRTDTRIPGYLQNHTKENFIWQLKITGVLFAGVLAYEYIDGKVREHRRNR